MRFGIPEELKKDRAYWDQPLWFRIYMRLFYALFGFIATGAFFDIYTPAPLWLQLFLATSVALAVLLFRVAYPNGFSGIQEWILEAMAEAQEDAEKKGMPYKGASSDEIKERLAERRKINRAAGKETGLPWKNQGNEKASADKQTNDKKESRKRKKS